MNLAIRFMVAHSFKTWINTMKVSFADFPSLLYFTPIAIVFPFLLIACDNNGHQITVVENVTHEGVDQSHPTAKQSQLYELFEEYYEEYLQLNPINATLIGDNRYNNRFPNTIGPKYRAMARALEEKYVAAVSAIDPAGLDQHDRTSYEMFKYYREIALEGLDHSTHLLPFNQFHSIPNDFVLYGSGSGLHPFTTVKDYDDFLERIDGFVVWMKQARGNMREGVERDFVHPQILMERVLPQLNSQVTDNPEDSLFFLPITKIPESFSSADKERLTLAYTAAIQEKLVPAYKMMRDFIRQEYMPACRDTAGINVLPGGAAWYSYKVRKQTTTDLTPDEIHELGVNEVNRIHGEMHAVMHEVGFDGSLSDFFEYLRNDPQFYYATREQLLDGYRALRNDVHSKARKLFNKFPKADYEIRAVEQFRERTTSAGYQRATPDGSRPGVFYVNTYEPSSRPKWAMESTFLHEAVPGHHFQGSLSSEVAGNYPRFRKFTRNRAYSEGWGLYAESLGKELGVYSDPYQYFGSLNAELWRAIRLVVDTGLHYKGWSREQVLDYMHSNSATSETGAISEAERYMATPALALAYKIGQLKIRELRTRAESTLGERFDVKAFHAQVLNEGAFPLSMLEAKIDRWLKSQETNM
jgi:uncharacterized protein (DUF885 family)